MNQPPPTDKQTGKRIVSKGEYVKMWGKRAALFVLSLCLLGAAGFGFQPIVYVVRTIVNSHFSQLYEAGVLGGILLTALILASIFGGGILLCAVAGWGANTFKKARYLDPGIPLTRANTADLPAPDSLVRASEEPMQEQQTILLRAATAGQERHEEQLVRAVTGEPEA